MSSREVPGIGSRTIERVGPTGEREVVIHPGWLGYSAYTAAVLADQTAQDLFAAEVIEPAVAEAVAEATESTQK